jgi:hypothetical protein
MPAISKWAIAYEGGLKSLANTLLYMMRCLNGKMFTPTFSDDSK